MHEISTGEPELSLISIFGSEDGLFIDVGANSGVYSYVGAKYFGGVIAFEPVPEMCRWLRSALPKSVTVVQAAVSDKAGTAELFIPEYSGEQIYTRSSLNIDANTGFAQHPISVEMKRLDDFDLGGRPISLIKIDVEGHEASVLKGAGAAIASSRCAVIVESEARHNAGAPFDIFEIMNGFGYQGFFVQHGTVHGIEDFELAVHQGHESAKRVGEARTGDYINNFIFIPSENATLTAKLREAASK